MPLIRYLFFKNLKVKKVRHPHYPTIQGVAEATVMINYMMERWERWKNSSVCPLWKEVELEMGCWGQ